MKKESQLMILNGGHTMGTYRRVDPTDNEDVEPVDEILMPTGSGNGDFNRPATDDEIEALQAYADENEILLPSAINAYHSKGTKKATEDDEEEMEVLLPPQV